MDLLKDRIDTLLAITAKLNDNPVANFCYDDVAMGSADSPGDADGVTVYDVANHQNIPTAQAAILKVNETVLTKGYRSKASSLTRMLLNHFFGRTSFNLNKIIAQLGSFFTYLQDSVMNPELTYGFASLDASGRVPYSQLPESAMEYEGNWDASTNTPTLVNGTGINGEFYIVSVAGTQNLGDSEWYTEVEPVGTENPQTEGWYVFDGSDYIPTTDQTVNPDETYYERHFVPGQSITFLENDRVIFDGNTRQWSKLASGNVRSVGGVVPDSAGNVPFGILNKNGVVNAPTNAGGLKVSVEGQKPDANGDIALQVGGKNATSGNFDITIAGKSFTSGNFPMTVGGGSQQSNNDWRLRINNKVFSGGDLSLYFDELYFKGATYLDLYAPYFGKKWFNPDGPMQQQEQLAADKENIFAVKSDGLYMNYEKITSLGGTSITGTPLSIALLRTDNSVYARYFFVTTSRAYIFTVNLSNRNITLNKQITTTTTSFRGRLKVAPFFTNKDCFALALIGTTKLFVVDGTSDISTCACTYNVNDITIIQSSGSEYVIAGTTNGLYYNEAYNGYSYELSSPMTQVSSSFTYDVRCLITPAANLPYMTNFQNVFFIGTASNGLWRGTSYNTIPTQVTGVPTTGAGASVVDIVQRGTQLITFSTYDTKNINGYSGYIETQNCNFTSNPSVLTMFKIGLPVAIGSLNSLYGKCFRIRENLWLFAVNTGSSHYIYQSENLTHWTLAYFITNRSTQSSPNCDFEFSTMSGSRFSVVEHKGSLLFNKDNNTSDYKDTEQYDREGN